MGGIPTSILYENKYAYSKTKYAGKGGSVTLHKGDIVRVTHDEGGHMFLVESVKKKGNTVTLVFRDGGHNDGVYHDTYKFKAKTGKGIGYYSDWKMQFVVTPDYSKLKFHKINFDANGGKVSQKSKYLSEGALYSVLPTPKKSGKKFAGWFTESGYQVKPYMTFGKKADQTLYARWK